MRTAGPLMATIEGRVSGSFTICESRAPSKFNKESSNYNLSCLYEMDLLEKKVDFGLVTIHIIRNIFFVVETGH